MTEEAKVILGIAVFTIIVVFGGVLLFGKNQPTEKKNSIKADENILIREDSYKISSSSAKATLVEFSDFQCPACRDAHPTIKQILEEDKGKINFVYRHFPLSQHQNSRIAAQAAEAAGEQGKFFEMGDLLFDNQDKWSDNSNPLDIFIEYAKQLNLDTEKFKQEIKDNKFADKIQRDENDGNKLGLNSTPTFFLNGEKLENLKSFSDIKQKVDQAVGK